MSPDTRKDHIRQEFDPPRMGVILGPGLHAVEAGYLSDISYALVDVHSYSRRECCIEFAGTLPLGPLLLFVMYDEAKSAWRPHLARAMDMAPGHVAGTTMIRLGYESKCSAAAREACARETTPEMEDLLFLLQSSLLSALPQKAFLSLVNILDKRVFAPDEHLFHQGDPGTSLFLIQKGACAVHAEKDHRETQIATLRENDVAGEMALLTGEPQNTTVTALTRLQAWELQRSDFEALAEKYEDLAFFLTELTTHRLESWQGTAERRVGNYLIKRKIGRGGWSIVYEGSHATLGFPVVIKMMKHDMALDETFQQVFRTEANVVANFNHPNIVRIWDIEERYKTIFIIMERLDGQTLDSLLASSGHLPYQQAADCLYQVCQALAYAHERGIVHRDIKPENIFMQSTGVVKVLDFGLAAPAGTEDFSIAGTPQYAPPEQIEGAPVDARSDLYSLGIMAFQMITGTRPFPEDDLMRLMELHVEQEIPDPALRVSGLPDELRTFIRRCCAREPDRRFANAVSAGAMLLPLIAEESRHPAEIMATIHVLCPEDATQELNAEVERFVARLKSKSFRIATSVHRLD